MARFRGTESATNVCQTRADRGWRPKRLLSSLLLRARGALSTFPRDVLDVSAPLRDLRERRRLDAGRLPVVRSGRAAPWTRALASGPERAGEAQRHLLA